MELYAESLTDTKRLATLEVRWEICCWEILIPSGSKQ